MGQLLFEPLAIKMARLVVAQHLVELHHQLIEPPPLAQCGEHRFLRQRLPVQSQLPEPLRQSRFQTPTGPLPIKGIEQRHRRSRLTQRLGSLLVTGTVLPGLGFALAIQRQMADPDAVLRQIELRHHLAKRRCRLGMGPGDAITVFDALAKQPVGDLDLGQTDHLLALETLQILGLQLAQVLGAAGKQHGIGPWIEITA